MKHLILTALTLIAGLQAEARSMKSFESAPLKALNLQTGTYLAEQNVTSGDVTVNYATNTVTLSFQAPMNCPAPMFCAMVMPAPILIEVPIQSIEFGQCNERIIRGEVNDTARDGLRSAITVVDNRAFSNLCKTFVAVEPTVINLELETPRPYRNEVYHFSAEALK